MCFQTNKYDPYNVPPSIYMAIIIQLTHMNYRPSTASAKVYTNRTSVCDFLMVSNGGFRGRQRAAE